ncbi:NTP transferase domain-containing protein [Acidipila sp. EB88]|uniref:nucleotidyltransferase family protein n=1 Tax=Acidipila sp. EB88 TaxID=2305226 RepID=UPI0013156689|nr:nucleotidyltransferase family protein [Acidipila sp. EB88]
MQPTSAPDAPGCAAILLAAGSSTRLGQPKQLVSYQGEPLVARAARLALAAGASPVVVVAGPHTAACREVLATLSVQIMENPEHAAGMGSSLRLGMQSLQSLQEPRPARVLVMVCDQPLLRVEHLRLLLDADCPDGIAAASYGEEPRRVGVPAVFDRRHFAALAAATGDQGARALLRSLPVTAVPIPEAAMDVDTPDDLARLRSR